MRGAYPIIFGILSKDLGKDDLGNIYRSYAFSYPIFIVIILDVLWFIKINKVAF